MSTGQNALQICKRVLLTPVPFQYTLIAWSDSGINTWARSHYMLQQLDLFKNQINISRGWNYYIEPYIYTVYIIYLKGIDTIISWWYFPILIMGFRFIGWSTNISSPAIDWIAARTVPCWLFGICIYVGMYVYVNILFMVQKSCTTCYILWNPMKHWTFSISTGAGFLSSTVLRSPNISGT